MTTDGAPTTGTARSAASFRVLAESAPVGMVETDLDGRVVWTNERWREITGVTDPTASLRDIDRLTHPDDRRRLAEAYRDALANRRDLDTEARIVRPDGAVRHVRVLGSPVVDDDGSLQSYVGVVQDVTDLHQAVDARQRSERRYRDLIDKAPVGQAVYLTDGVMVEVNKAWADLLGYRPDEVIGRKAIEFVHPDDRDATLQLARSLLRGDIEVSSVDRRLVHHDGSTVWVASSIRVERDQDGAPLHFHSLIVDITASVVATEALRESEARYRRLIDEAPVGQVISRTDGSLVEVNRAFVDLLDSSRDELFARDPRELFHPDDLPGLAAQLARLLDGEIDSFQSERRLVRPDGSIVWVAGGTTVVEQRGTRYLHSVMHDITERKLAEDALTQSEERYRTVIEALHDGVLVQSLEHVEAVNESAVRMLGHGPAALGEVATYDAMDPIDEQGHPIPLAERATIRAMREARPMLNEVAGLLVPDRGRRWFNFNAVPRLRDGKVVGAVTTFSDITEAKAASDALRESENRFRTLAESLPVGVFQYGPDVDLVYVNPRWLEIVEIAEQEALGTTGVDFIHPDDVDRVVDRFLRHLDARHPYQSQYRVLTPSGTVKWVSAYGTTLRDPETGAMTAFIGSLEDITPLVDAQEETSRLAGIVESTSDLVSLTDHETGELLYLNKAARDLLGFSDRSLLGVRHLDLLTPEAVAMWEGAVRPTLERGESWSGELPMKAADGSIVHVWQTVAVKRRADGTVFQLSAVGRDVTERRRFEAELAHQATHDALTDLPNRALLLDHLDLALARAARDGRLVALLFLDLDRFKRVNDSMGHQAGDDLLVAVADRIGAMLRPTDTVARLGGDEFVVLCEDVADEHHAVAVAQRILSALEGEPFAVGDDALVVTASVGIALSAGGPDAHGEALLRDADAAMYRAKDQGRARLELFDESMRRRAAKRLELADQLAAAIEHGAITVHFQPCVDLTDGTVTSIEALARWEHPSRGLLGPYEFIGLAEDTGLIVGLGLRVLTVACTEGRRWQLELGERAPRVHVNLSARQLATPNLPVLVEGVLASTGLDPRLLCLEITESVLMDDAASAIEVLGRLKRLGLSIAIDDFGTGYSSLSYLRRFPVDVLKVDRSFVDGLGPDPEDSAIVAAIIGLAHTLDLEAVAEGVENTEQLAELRRLGCTAGQGFHFARPAPARAIERHLHDGFAV